MLMDVKDYNDIVEMDSYTSLRDHLQNKIIEFISCACIEAKEIGDAMQSAYQ